VPRLPCRLSLRNGRRPEALPLDTIKGTAFEIR
jgi:hypothetical protein